MGSSPGAQEADMERSVACGMQRKCSGMQWPKGTPNLGDFGLGFGVLFYRASMSIV